MCGKAVQGGKQIVERIDGIEYVFDKDECALMFKKFKSVYGTDFCMNVTT
jgi:hypothetical protein